MEGEMLKGHLDMIVLAALSAGPAHGYAVIEELKRRSAGAFDLPEGTIYPVLHRLKQARLLETMQHRIDRPLREVERTSAPALEFLDDGVAVGGARRQRREHDHVEMPLEHFPFHGRANTTRHEAAFAAPGSRRCPNARRTSRSRRARYRWSSM